MKRPGCTRLCQITLEKWSREKIFSFGQNCWRRLLSLTRAFSSL